MQKVALNGHWRMRPVKEAAWMPAQVPGSVYSDLMKNGQMEDPHYRDNELSALALMDEDYVYETVFDRPAGYENCQEIELQFDGVDTLATITLNGTCLAEVNNMHRTWVFPVKQLLTEKDNRLEVLFHSPTRFIAEEYEKDHLDGSEEAMKGFSKLRKAHCMFGWDWGIRLPDAGLWREVSLVGIGAGRIEDVYVTQKHEGGQVELQIAVHATEGLSYTVRLTDPDGAVVQSGEKLQQITVEQPQLWWPNGYGAQPLYTVEVTLYDGDTAADRWKRRIGLRTLTMSRIKDAYGEQFAHEINGIRIFAMGADYIPEDTILSRVAPERTRQLLEQAKFANYNVIRVWGGGHYPSDAFYDICDELGLIVWQDFMFACAHYVMTDEFEENVRQEFIDNVRRIRHHASLGLWCGNNEMEMFTAGNLWTDRPSDKADYIKLYEYVLPKVLKEYDPETFYWPASPSSGGSFDDPNDENRGDVHYWDVWHGGKPFTEYRRHYFRYLSEFGFQSFPFLKTVETFTEPEDRNIFSYVMEKHQRNGTANGKIMNYLQQTFLYPAKFETLLFASQILQAEAVRYGIEHCRRNRGRCMGTVVWQLNDNWPVASWASIDYCGRLKALHYAEKRSFEQVTVFCREEGMQTQWQNVNEQPRPIKKSVAFTLCNDSLEPVTALLRYALRTPDGAILEQYEETMTAEALSVQTLPEKEFPQADIFENYVSYELYVGEDCITSGTVNFCPHKYFHYQDPALTCEAAGDSVTVTAGSYAKYVEIQNENEDLVLEDNYFDMNGGQRTLRVISGEMKGLHVRSVYDIR